MSGPSKRALLAAAVALLLGGFTAAQCFQGSTQHEFDAGARFGRGRSADACLAEIRRTSLDGRRSFLGLADKAFAAGCFGSAEGNLRRCASIPPAKSPDGYAWRSEICGEVGKATADCHVQLGVIQEWCDRAHPVQ